MKAIRLKTNHRSDPLGTEDRCFRFSWNCEGGIRQTAFRLTVLDESGNTVHDSGVCESGRMWYETRLDLPARSAYRWRVLLTDEQGEQELSAEARFESGLFGNWQASWITIGRYSMKWRL